MAAAHHLRMQAAIHQQRHTGNEKSNEPPKTKNVSMNRNDTRGMSEHGFDTVATVCISRVLQRSRGYAIVEQATIGKNSRRSFSQKFVFFVFPTVSSCVFLPALTFYLYPSRSRKAKALVRVRGISGTLWPPSRPSTS